MTKYVINLITFKTKKQKKSHKLQFVKKTKEKKISKNKIPKQFQLKKKTGKSYL